MLRNARTFGRRVGKRKNIAMDSNAFDDRDGIIWYDGETKPWKDADVHVLTHGLHYASCVFEGERSYSGNIFKLREHTERLVNSAKILGFEIPYSIEEIDAACNEVCELNGIVDGYIRPVAWRGICGLHRQQSACPEIRQEQRRKPWSCTKRHGVKYRRDPHGTTAASRPRTCCTGFPRCALSGRIDRTGAAWAREQGMAGIWCHGRRRNRGG